ncbi:MAG: methyltransferase [Thermoplasmatales archaeon]|nr:MAG: methyltransferase [Thermoplasmatales archaeon]
MKKDKNTNFFHFKGLTLEIHPEVYNPAEDTFLLIEALDVVKGKSVLEIGTGCGIISLDCARIGANVVCTDINPFAVDLTKRNYSRNKHLVKGDFDVRKGDLFKPIKNKEVFDIIIFNPPYLPTEKKDIVGGSGWFDVATNGGATGIKITTRFIDELTDYLKQNGKSYFIFSSLSDSDKLESLIKKKKFQFNVVSCRSFDFETISVYCLTKK